MARPSLTIVTPVLNRADMIAEAIASVHTGAGETVEHIVIDAGSTDGTVDIVRRHDQVRLIMAPGSGIYEALNIGIREASGTVIGHLNSDDLLPAGALDAVLTAFEQNPDAESVRGVARYTVLDETRGAVEDAHLNADYPPTLTLADIVDGHLSINAMFIRAEAYRRIGLYDETLPLAADREWLLRAWLAGLRIHQIASHTYLYRRHGQSLTLDPARANAQRLRREALDIAGRYLGRRDLPPAARAACLRWHAKNAFMLSAGLLGVAQSAGEPIAVLGRCFAVDGLWPLRLMHQLPALAARRLARKRTLRKAQG